MPTMSMNDFTANYKSFLKAADIEYSSKESVLESLNHLNAILPSIHSGFQLAATHGLIVSLISIHDSLLEISPKESSAAYAVLQQLFPSTILGSEIERLLLGLIEFVAQCDYQKWKDLADRLIGYCVLCQCGHRVSKNYIGRSRIAVAFINIYSTGLAVDPAVTKYVFDLLAGVCDDYKTSPELFLEGHLNDYFCRSVLFLTDSITGTFRLELISPVLESVKRIIEVVNSLNKYLARDLLTPLQKSLQSDSIFNILLPNVPPGRENAKFAVAKVLLEVGLVPNSAAGLVTDSERDLELVSSDTISIAFMLDLEFVLQIYSFVNDPNPKLQQFVLTAIRKQVESDEKLKVLRQYRDLDIINVALASAISRDLNNESVRIEATAILVQYIIHDEFSEYVKTTKVLEKIAKEFDIVLKESKPMLLMLRLSYDTDVTIQLFAIACISDKLVASDDKVLGRLLVENHLLEKLPTFFGKRDNECAIEAQRHVLNIFEKLAGDFRNQNALDKYNCLSFAENSLCNSYLQQLAMHFICTYITNGHTETCSRILSDARLVNSLRPINLKLEGNLIDLAVGRKFYRYYFTAMEKLANDKQFKKVFGQDCQRLVALVLAVVNNYQTITHGDELVVLAVQLFSKEAFTEILTAYEYDFIESVFADFLINSQVDRKACLQVLAYVLACAKLPKKKSIRSPILRFLGLAIQYLNILEDKPNTQDYLAKSYVWRMFRQIVASDAKSFGPVVVDSLQECLDNPKKMIRSCLNDDYMPLVEDCSFVFLSALRALSYLKESLLEQFDLHAAAILRLDAMPKKSTIAKVQLLKLAKKLK